MSSTCDRAPERLLLSDTLAFTPRGWAPRWIGGCRLDRVPHLASRPGSRDAKLERDVISQSHTWRYFEFAFTGPVGDRSRTM
jgi:hypothetical protein